MKNIKLLIVSLLASFCVVSCADMDIDPYTIISEDDVMTNKSGVEAYLVRLYDGLPLEDMRYSAAGFNGFGGIPFIMHMSDEAIAHNWDYGGSQKFAGDNFQTWKYENIRDVNKFLSLLLKFQSYHNENDVKAWRGEAHIMRAYHYFALAKRYGGVPLVKSVQDFTGSNLEELQIKRNTEQEIYDYIEEQLDSAALYLPQTSETGRFTLTAAYAYKSKMMLYAASVAKFGDDTDPAYPYQGIPSGEANRYYESAKKAARSAINEGTHSLYQVNPDKTNNYTELFLDENKNSEAIMVKKYKYPDLTHNFDVWGLPYAYRSSGGYGSNFCPTLDFVERYETTDGEFEKPFPIYDQDGNPISYAHPLDIFEGRDPRLAATVILPNDLWRGQVVGIQKGVIENGVLYPATKLDDKTPNGVSISGNCGFTDAGETTTTSFHLRKYLDSNLPAGEVWSNRCDQDWIDIRLAEVYLNFAEAAVETGNDLPEALAYINLIRDRAGIKGLELSQLTRERVRNERRVELAFENHTYWDVRRWRTAHTEFSNRTFWALHPYRNLDTGTWFFERKKYEPAGLPRKTFQERFYYNQIPGDQIQKNPNLTQNKGY